MCVYTVIYINYIYIYYQHKHAKIFEQSLRVRSKETWLNQFNYSFIFCFLFLLFVARLRMAILASIQSSKSYETHKPHQPKATGNVGWVTQKFLFSLSLYQAETISLSRFDESFLYFRYIIDSILVVCK